MDKYLLEREISEKIQKDNGCLAHFIWEFKPAYGKNSLDTLELKIVTINPKHNNHFLLHKATKIITNRKDNIDDIYCDVLKEVIEILNKKCATNPLHYAIGWRDISNEELKFNTVTSYFSGQDFKEIMEKFYFEKCEKNIIIDSVKLLPDS